MLKRKKPEVSETQFFLDVKELKFLLKQGVELNLKHFYIIIHKTLIHKFKSEIKILET